MSATWPPFVKNWVLPFLHSQPLRPVLIAILGHFGVAFALPVLAVVRGGDAANIAVLFLVVALSLAPVVEELRIERRPGAFAVTVAAAWGIGLGIAGLGWWSGAI